MTGHGGASVGRRLEIMYSRNFLEQLYRTLYTIRVFETECVKLYRQGLIIGYFHPYLGQEAIAAGVCAALRKDDYIVSTHRGHGHCIAKGGELSKMAAELLGRETGYCRGRGGSMHIADVTAGNIGANGIVAGGIPIGVGAGLGISIRGTDQVVVIFFSDGAANNAVFAESLNLAAIWDLPVVFLLENNQYAVTSPIEKMTRVPDLYRRGEGYGVPASVVDGNDVLAVYEKTKEAVQTCREGCGPVLLEAKTYRYGGHHVNDPGLYMPKDRVEYYKAHDPVKMGRKYLLELGGCSEPEIAAIEEQVNLQMAQAVEFAKSSPQPSVQEFLKEVEHLCPVHRMAYPRRQAGANLSATQTNPHEGTDRQIMYREALNEALREEMRRDETVFIMGVCVAERGGSYKVTAGLLEEFGPRRVIDTPISEASFTGAGVGAAITGMRPVVEVLFIDFMSLAIDQIVNQAAKYKFISGGKGKVPLVLRTQGGSGNGLAAQHSQSLEAWYYHVPGLKVVMPSTPYDAKGLLKSAIRDDDPVIFIEHKLLYMTKGAVPVEEYTIDIGVGQIKRYGGDVTIVAWSNMVHRALSAAQKLAEQGIEAEVIDPRTLVPLDKELILDSVRKTEHLVIVQEAVRRGGVASDIASIVQYEAFDCLDAPIEIVAGKNTPIPFNINLERASAPQENDIIEAVKRSLHV